MHITFGSQRGVGEVAEEICFYGDVSLKFACWDAREGERWLIISEARLIHFSPVSHFYTP